MGIRPRIKLTLSATDQVIEILGWLVLFLLWGLTVYHYKSLPQIIPIHFDGAGKVNGFGSKSKLFLLPVIGTFLFIMLTVLNKYPHVFNYPTEITPENAVKQYTNATRMMRYIKLVMLLLFTAIVWTTISVAKGKLDALSPWFLPVALCFIFIPTAFFLFKSIRSK